MEIAGPRLGDTLDYGWPFLVFRREVRCQDLKLLNHVGIRVYRCGAVATRIRDVRAVSCNVERGRRKAVNVICAVKCALAAAVSFVFYCYGYHREIRSILGSGACNGKTRHYFNEL